MTFVFASLPYPYTGPSGSDSTPKWHLKLRPSSLQSSWQFLEQYQPLVVYAVCDAVSSVLRSTSISFLERTCGLLVSGWSGMGWGSGPFLSHCGPQGWENT